MSGRGVLRVLEAGRVGFHCPGCESMHVVNVGAEHPGPRWTFNWNYEHPTFDPSVLVAWGHHVAQYGRGPGSHCQFGCDDPADPQPACCGVCHSYVVDGQIRFLHDCTHKLAGQTVPLPSQD